MLNILEQVKYIIADNLIFMIADSQSKPLKETYRSQLSMLLR